MEGFWVKAALFMMFGPIILVISFIFMKFPPKKINGLYGYRTPRSMKDQDSWDFANAYCSRLMFKSSLAVCIFQLICFILLPTFISVIIASVTTLIGVIAAIPMTESQLRKKFGQPR